MDMGLKAYVTCMTSQGEVNRQLLLCVHVCTRVRARVCVCVCVHACMLCICDVRDGK